MLNKTTVQTTAALTLAAMLAGCATAPMHPNGVRQDNSQYPQAADADPCSVGTTAAAGAAVGALLGALVSGKNGALKGAAIGGGLAAAGCLAFNVNSRQTKTAAQADRDYIRARGSLPREPQVVSYTPQLSAGTVKRGQPFKVTSVVELVNGSAQNVTDVREELVVLDPQGQPFKSGSKELSSTSKSGGRFENSFELTLPPGVSQGVYGVKTNLYVNGKLAATRDMRTQLVILDTDHKAPQLALR
ncbi:MULTISPECIES: hypothetical protein [unclassified Janthinobacterium]|uniref:hypothetical protein n=1 Tax=unclassified Janthinobacterium TaxID=2610881 RepID=UPI00161524B5|nr:MULTISPECIES: hypothetical protein [unclassified Janthinobacterium]MBB5608410.1 hypothetical protein [Janthinobacterium sp. S3T4]MBB5613624.1 hypothetical protein [Janthinobacterium sp. S3M3]